MCTGHRAEFRPSPEFPHFSICKTGLVGAFENYGAESDILLEFSSSGICKVSCLLNSGLCFETSLPTSFKQNCRKSPSILGCLTLWIVPKSRYNAYTMASMPFFFYFVQEEQWRMQDMSSNFLNLFILYNME